MIRRTLMRRAYNKGDWQTAKHHASKLTNIPKEQELARSVLIRACWNQEDYSEVIHLNSLWGNAFQALADRAEKSLQTKKSSEKSLYHPRIQAIHSSQPVPEESGIEWNDEDYIQNFIQEGSRLWMIHPHGWTHWDMPKEFVLSETHSDLLRLTAEILLYPWHKSTRSNLEGTRQLGTLPSLAFSAGTDSTAAALIMPKNTILGYHRRNFEGILDHRNADRLLEFMRNEKQRRVIDISSNHELLRTYHSKQTGFSSDFACASHLILLADHFDIGAIAFGMPLDNTWLMKGRTFREFTESQYFNYWTERFLKVGLELLLPIAGLSEAGAMKICENEEILPYLNSCLRGDGTNGCGKCWKCFLKNGPLGRPFDIKANEIQVFLQRRPLPTAMHALWALQQLQLESEVPDLKEYLKQDLSWWKSYYPPAKEIIPERWKEEIWQNITHHLNSMEKPYPVEIIALSF
jgi:hypothetical protein